LFFSVSPRPPSSPLFPYTTLFRSGWDRGWRRRAPPPPPRAYDPHRILRDRLQVLLLIAPRKSKPQKPFWGNPSGWAPSASLRPRSEEHTSELQSRENLVCRLLLEK